MAHWKKSFPSKYLQVADLDGGSITATIQEVVTDTLGAGADAELKLIVKFAEPDVKALVCNLTRGDAIEEIAGTAETTEWPGTVIQLVKGTTRYQGKKVGCIVVQAPLDTMDVGF